MWRGSINETSFLGPGVCKVLNFNEEFMYFTPLWSKTSLIWNASQFKENASAQLKG